MYTYICKEKTTLITVRCCFIILGKKHKPSTFHADTVSMHAMHENSSCTS